MPGFHINDFKPIELTDKSVFDRFFSEEQPETSELTFTNLFMWRHCYRSVWREWNGFLLVILHEEDGTPFGLPPVGGGDKAAALDALMAALRSADAAPRVTRVGKKNVGNYVDPERYRATEDRDNHDYVYLALDLVQLAGRKFHRKKNHLNKFLKNYEFEYKELTQDLVGSVLDMQEAWCELRNCAQSESLLDEDGAIRQALAHYETLGFKGGAILIDSKVEAFAIGEMLNRDTAVIHVEKANPDIPGIYAAINQLFCQAAWSQARYVNREQDLGIDSLRKAKISYNPDHLVKKYVLIPKDAPD